MQEIFWNVPLQSTVTQERNNKKITKIKGIAINSTTTRNNVKYEENELRNSARTLEGKPLLKDHNNSVDSIVGRVTKSYFDEINSAVGFEADILDEKVAEKVSNGLISAVSVGATVMELEENKKEKVMIPRGINFVELSLVAIPADPNASLIAQDFTAVLCEKFRNKADELEELNNQIKVLKEEVRKLKTRKFKSNDERITTATEIERLTEDIDKKAEEIANKGSLKEAVKLGRIKLRTLNLAKKPSFKSTVKGKYP